MKRTTVHCDFCDKAGAMELNLPGFPPLDICLSHLKNMVEFYSQGDETKARALLRSFPVQMTEGRTTSDVLKQAEKV